MLGKAIHSQHGFPGGGGEGDNRPNVYGGSG